MRSNRDRAILRSRRNRAHRTRRVSRRKYSREKNGPRRPMKPAVVLLSGGLDSTTTLATAIAEGYETYALSFEYGQRHRIEIDAACRIARALGAKKHPVATIDLRTFG